VTSKPGCVKRIMMRTDLDPDIGAMYKSASQQARVITETWVEDEMFCPACESPSLERLPHGTRVRDFRCPECAEEYQCKSLSAPIRSRVVDSAYSAMIEAILKNEIPSLMLLHYSRRDWRVEDLLLIPSHLLSLSAIEKREPLGPNARRAGWVGCNILLDCIPATGRIFAVKNGATIDPAQVRLSWKQLSFLRSFEPPSRGWFLDVLNCVQSLGKPRFSLGEAYDFEDRLSSLHPENRNIKPKIRQQLQVLRDRGLLRFVLKGEYELLGDTRT